MKFTRTAVVAGLIAGLLVSPPAPAQFGDFLQNFAGKVVISWSDLETRVAELDKQVAELTASGKLTATQSADFKTSLAKLKQEVDQGKASGRRLGITQSFTYSNQLNAIASEVNLAVEHKLTTVPDIDKLKTQLQAQIDAAASSGQLNAQSAASLRTELAQVAQIEAAFKTETGGNLTPRQIEILADGLSKVQAKVDLQIKVSQSAIPVLEERRAGLEKRVSDGIAAGKISATEAAAFRAELQKIATDQASMQATGGGLLNGSQVLKLASDLQGVSDKIDARIAVTGSTATSAEFGTRLLTVANRIETLTSTGRLSPAEASLYRADLQRIATEHKTLELAGGGVLTAAQKTKLAGDLQLVSDRLDARAGGGAAAGATTNVSVQELGSRRDRLVRRIGMLRRSGRLAPRDAQDLLNDVNQIAELERAYSGAVGGITDAQVQKLRQDLGRIAMRVRRAGMPVDNRPPQSDDLLSLDDPGLYEYSEQELPPVATTIPTRVDTSTGASGTTGATISLPVISQKNFNDVGGFWGERYILELASRGVIGGFPNGTFRPNDQITRAQFAAIAVNALKLPPATGTSNFTDLPATHWAANAIGAASNAGLISGFPDGSFRPEDKITRAQALVILSKALKNVPNTPAGLSAYSDKDAVPDWASNNVAQAANAGIIVSFPDANQIRPNSLATRGDVAALMYQTLSAMGADLPRIQIGVQPRTQSSSH